LRSVIAIFLATIVFNSAFAADEEIKTEEPDSLPHRPPAGKQKIKAADVPAELLYTMDPIDVPIFKYGKHQGYLGITVSWQAKDLESRDKIKRDEPRLRDMIITDMHAALYLLWKPGELPKKSQVEKRLMSSSEKIMGLDVIDKIYTRDFYVKKKAGR
jgi:flagellar basal body-associated protein FliL